MIIKNSFFNAAALVIPGLFFIPATAYLARSLGVEQFGLLLLMYAVLGYSGIFDAGMGRAVIRKIAQSSSKKEELITMGTSLSTVMVLSSIPVVIISVFSFAITEWLNVSEENFYEMEAVLNLVAYVIPFFLTTVVAFSYLEGKEKFLQLSIYKVVTGAAMAIAPAIAVYNEPTLVAAVYGLLYARIFTAVVALVSLNKALGLLNLRFDSGVLVELVKFGGWVSVSNIVSPIMVYMDRFLVSNSVGAANAAFYNAPADLIEKISFIPGSLARTIFPFFSRLGSHVEWENRIYFGLSLALLLILVPLFLVAELVLTLWLGESYGIESSTILRVIIIGFFFNALAQIPFAAIQAKGRSKLTALLHLSELLPYLLLLFYLVDTFGLLGAAYAWSVRVIMDFILLFYFSKRV